MTIAAGQRVRIARRNFSSVSTIIEFGAEPIQPGDRVSGTVERLGSRWILGRTHTQTPLLGVNRVHKAFWDTLFDVYVTPDIDVEITTPRSSLRLPVVVIVLAVAVVLTAVAVALRVIGG